MENESGTAAPRQSGPRRFLGLLVGVLIAPIIVGGFASAPWLMGFEDPALRAIEGCPLASDALGAPVARSWLGMSCGNAESGDSHGHASWTFPVVGSRGSGSLSVVAEQRGGSWTVLRETLDVGERTYDVVSCVESAGRLVVRPASYEATVTSAMGAPGVAPGDLCRIAISAAPEGTYPCRVQITCGDRTLYGAGTTGYTSCGLDASGALMVRDGSPTPTGGDPTLDLRVATGEAILTDQVAAGTWAVALRFDDGH